jgi:phosphoglycolate phosphatase
MNKRFDLIIFDWDGTLVDSIDWIVSCLQIAAKAHDCHIPTPQAAKNIIGLSIDKAITELFPTISLVTAQSLVEHYRQAFFSKQMSPDDLFSGVYTMLNELKQAGYYLAVATGKNRQGLDYALQATQTREFFCTSRCADETSSKPHPKMLEEIMQQMNIKAARTVMVGDSSHDLQMANKANISAIGVACGAHSTATLQAYQPLLCLKKTTELLEII